MIRKYEKTVFSYLIYFFLPLLILIIFKSIVGSEISGDYKLVATYSLICDFVLFILISLINLDIFKEHKNLKVDKKKNKVIAFVELLIITTLMFYVVKIIASFITLFLLNIFNLNGSTANNQDALILLFKEAPILMTITGVLFAPVVEELIFRGLVKRIIKNKWVFITVSGLIFGLVHVLTYDLPIFIILILGYLLDMIISSNLSKGKKIRTSIYATIFMIIVMFFGLHIISGNIAEVIYSIELSEVINSIVYIAAGVFLAYIYYIYDNIYLNISVHAVNNLLSYIILFTYL